MSKRLFSLELIGIAARALHLMVKEDYSPGDIVDEKSVIAWLEASRSKAVHKFWNFEKINLPPAPDNADFHPQKNIELLAGLIVAMYCQGDIYLDNLLLEEDFPTRAAVIKATNLPNGI